MNASTCCSECKQRLRVGADRCTCGWRPPQQRAAGRPDYRCEYQALGRRCPLPGTISPSLYGNGPWYCAGHWRSLDDPRLGEAVLRHAEENYHAILATYRDWRDVLMEARLGSRDKSL